MRPFSMPRIAPRLAFDRAEQSAWTIDVDGRMHVKSCHISKACINGYAGRELPQWQALGLDPARIYRMLRDPRELEIAAPSFNSIPLLSTHKHVTATNHQPDIVIGATGSDATFNYPYLDCSLVVWSGEDIAEIKDDTKAELSCSYRFDADMTPCMFEGERADGVMRAIVGQHVAVVTAGRAGSECRIGGAALASDARPLSAEAAFSLRFGRAPRRL